MFNFISTWYKRYFTDPQASLLVILLAVGLIIFVTMGKMLAPLLAALVIAYLLEGAVHKLEKKTKELDGKTGIERFYNKSLSASNDIFFKDEVIIDDGESQLYSDNLDIVMSNNFVKVYNSVRFSENANWMVADKIEIDLRKKTVQKDFLFMEVMHLINLLYGNIKILNITLI